MSPRIAMGPLVALAVRIRAVTNKFANQIPVHKILL